MCTRSANLSLYTRISNNSKRYMDGQVISKCQILSVIVINILRKSCWCACPSPTHYKSVRMLHFSMSNIYFSTQIAYFTSSLSNMKLMLKAILDQHRNKTLGFCHNGEMDALIYYVIQQNAFALAYIIC